MSKGLIERRAIDAAAKVRSDQWSAETCRSGQGWTWDELTTEDQAKCIEWVEPIVAAALTEVESSIKAIADSGGAAIDLWWKTTGDWPVQEFLPGKYIHAVLQAVGLHRAQEDV